MLLAKMGMIGENQEDDHDVSEEKRLGVTA